MLYPHVFLKPGLPLIELSLHQRGIVSPFRQTYLETVLNKQFQWRANFEGNFIRITCTHPRPDIRNKGSKEEGREGVDFDFSSSFVVWLLSWKEGKAILTQILPYSRLVINSLVA